jgi:hypothetical protein
VAVPKERELLLEGRGARRHAIEPPRLELEFLLPVAEADVGEERGLDVGRGAREVEELIDRV